tara:strand:+ start:2381 stop:5422 length:3042 start_codon:yes stop_codon:yes gene_type:complete
MADESTTPTGGAYRENINDLLYDAYTAARGADADIDFSDWGLFEEARANTWKVEAAVQDAFYDLNEKVIGGSATDLEKAARDVIFDKIQGIEENREALREEGIDPSMFGADLPLAEMSSQFGGQEFTQAGVERGEPTTSHYRSKSSTSAANSRAIAEADDASDAGTAAPIEDVELTQDAQGSALVRGTYQCYLLYNLGYYSGIHKTLLSDASPRHGYRGLENGHIKTPGYWSDQYNRQKILLLEEERNSSAALNKLQICSGNENFAKIKTSEYAQIQPMLKIYKIYANSKSGMVEMEFGTDTNLDGISKELTVDYPIGNDSAKLFGRGANSGVKSFEWKFLGTDPFTATRDVEATLKLHFQHFSELLKVRSGLDQTSKTPESLDYTYLDLVIQPDCRDKDAAKKDVYTRRYAPECYEIRIDVGYHEPGSNMSLSAETRESIACQRQSLFLTLVDHKFEFKNDGTFDMTVTYRGRLGTIMRDRKFNVLMPGGGFLEVEFENPDDPDADPIGILDLENRIMFERGKDEPSEANLKLWQRQKESFFVTTKQSVYNGILDTMGKAGMIRTEPLTTAEWNAFSRWQQGEDGQFSLPEPKSAFGGGSTPNAENSAQIETQAASTDVDADGTGNANADVEAEAEAKTGRLAKLAKRKKQIDYIFLGDLIAHVYDNVTGERIFQGHTNTRWRFWYPGSSDWGRPSGTTSRVMTTSPSNVRLLELLHNNHIVLGNIEAHLARPTTPEEFVVNIAHIPISLEVFRQFWTEKVLMQNRTFYSFFQFLDDLLQDMLTQAISSGCFGGLLDHPVRAQSALITSKNNVNKKVFKTGSNFWKSIHANSSTNDNPAFDTRIDETGPGATQPKEYLILQVADTAPHDLYGDYREDLDRGIIHTGYGRDRGLLKSVQFTKTDQEYLPEARYASEGDFVFNQLANVYDATFNLVGTTIFKPGQHIYFDPSDQGIGSPPERKEDSAGNVTYQSWSNLMGLGGYHLVTEIAHMIDRSGFNTTVKARWVTSGRMK